LLWRLAGATQPAYVLIYHLSYRSVVFGRYVLSDPTRRLWIVDPIPQPGIRVNTTGSFIDVELPLEALRPEDGTWEIQIGTAYRGRDDVYWLVDWLAWTRLVLR
jgi:hypothetical protein